MNRNQADWEFVASRGGIMKDEHKEYLLLSTFDEPELEAHPILSKCCKFDVKNKFTHGMEFLQTFSTVIVYGGMEFENPQEMSLLLAKYVENGGGVVVLRAANEATGPWSLDWNFPHVRHSFKPKILVRN